MSLRPVVGLQVLLAACATTTPAGQGGTTFTPAPEATAPAPVVPGAPLERLFDLCWPADATAQQQVVLTRQPNGDYAFEAKEGASNSTARCLRELATTYPGTAAPAFTLGPPSTRPSGWTVLAYVHLLSPSRFGPERGLLDPAPLAHACLAHGDSPRSGVLFAVSFESELKVRLQSQGMPVEPLTDSERCLQAVLGATVWPATRPFTFDFAAKDPGMPKGDVAHYFGPAGGAAQALDPVKVKESISSSGPAVSACWEAALLRRAGLGGGRSVRLRVGDTGGVSSVTVVGNVSAEPNTAADFLLDGCLVAAAQKVRFPGGAAGDGIYSWVFAERR